MRREAAIGIADGFKSQWIMRHRVKTKSPERKAQGDRRRDVRGKRV
jgi:hypothetical protein